MLRFTLEINLENCYVYIEYEKSFDSFVGLEMHDVLVQVSPELAAC